MTEGDIYIQKASESGDRFNFAVIERFSNQEGIVFRFIGSQRNTTWPLRDFNDSFRVATPREFNELIDSVRSSFNHLMHRLEQARAQFRDSKSIVEKLKDLAENQDIMSKEDVLKEHLISITRESPSINITNDQALISLIGHLFSSRLAVEGDDNRGVVDIDGMNNLREALRRVQSAQTTVISSDEIRTLLDEDTELHISDSQDGFE